MMRKSLIPAFFLLAGLAWAGAWNLGLLSLPARNSAALGEKTQAEHTSPSPAPAPATTTGPSGPLPGGFTEESLALGRTTNDPLGDEARLAALAAKLDKDSARFLTTLALSDGLPHTDRFLATYLLGLRAADFPGELETIAASDNPTLGHRPPPHSLRESNWHFEVSMRVAALAALDHSPDRARAAAFFLKVEESHSNETVRKVARVGRVGTERSEALIDSYLTAKAEGALRDATQD